MLCLKICLTLLLLVGLEAVRVSHSQVLFENDKSQFKVSGYLRTGIGRSEGGATQAHFQMPGALNKFSFGNQADTYGELEFDYTHWLNAAKTKSMRTLVPQAR